jgi:hypothetical protein
MVELEDQRIGLATVDTGVRPEELDQERNPLFGPGSLATRLGFDVALAIGSVMRLAVLGSAWPAIGVDLDPCRPRELIAWLGQPAP